MPPRDNTNIKLFYRASDNKWRAFGEITDVDLIGDEPEDIDAESFLSSIYTFTISFKIISGSNKRRMHGKKAYRMRTYRKWRKYEIHRRTFGQISTGNSD